MSNEPSRPLIDTPGYGQLCPMGFALDAVGDRWTMLVLRDLARTELRFRDLQAINPGMSPNLLTLRLRKLEQAGLVERRPVPPGNTVVYALTDDTRDKLLPVLIATAELGSFLIDRLPTQDLATMDLPNVLARQMNLNGHFVTARPSDLTGYFLLDLSGIATHVTVGPTFFSASPDAPHGPPDATLTFFPPTSLMRIMGHSLTIAEAEATGLLTIDGDRDGALELLRLLSFAPPTGATN